jgi:O-antigen/teichoic acid export membrane protein
VVPTLQPKNSMHRWLFAIVSTALRIFSSIGSLAIFARTIDISDFASLALGLLAAQIACVFLDGGVNTEILKSARLESDESSNKRLNDSASIRIVLGCTALCFLAAYQYWMHGSESARFFAAAFAAGVCGAITESYLTNLKAKDKFKEEFFATVAQSGLVLIFSLGTFVSPLATPVLLLLPRILSLAILMSASGYKATSILLLKPKKIVGYYFQLKHYSVDAIFSNINGQLDGLLVVSILGKTAYALYQPISRLYGTTLSFGAIIAAIAIPKSTLMSTDRRLGYLNSTFLVFGSLLALGFGFFLQYAVAFLFGEKFRPHFAITLILMALIIFRFGAAGSGSFLMVLGHQRQRALINAAVTVISIILAIFIGSDLVNIFLILMAAQVALFLTYLILAVKCSRELRG